MDIYIYESNSDKKGFYEREVIYTSKVMDTRGEAWLDCDDYVE